uniref:Uncharacterized protein n=1 Tax=Trichobilharzia regenti TaxID=157069 RepID=A0AA85JII9_TRIRE|nr:unnamed protein product [Trichobilharzia regenti]
MPILRAGMSSSLPNLNHDGEYPTPAAPPNSPWSYSSIQKKLPIKRFAFDGIARRISWDSCMEGPGCNPTPIRRCSCKVETPVTRSLHEQPNSAEKQRKGLESVNGNVQRKDDHPLSVR